MFPHADSHTQVVATLAAATKRISWGAILAGAFGGRRAAPRSVIVAE